MKKIIALTLLCAIIFASNGYPAQKIPYRVKKSAYFRKPSGYFRDARPWYAKAAETVGDGIKSVFTGMGEIIRSV